MFRLSHHSCLLACPLKTLTVTVSLYLITSFVDNFLSLLPLNMIWANIYQICIENLMGTWNVQGTRSWESPGSVDRSTWCLKGSFDTERLDSAQCRETKMHPNLGMEQGGWMRMRGWKNWAIFWLMWVVPHMVAALFTTGGKYSKQ